MSTLTAALVISCAATHGDTLPSGDSSAHATGAVSQRSGEAVTPNAAADTLWLLAADPADDAVHASDTHETLVARYGAANVRREDFDEGEGGLVPGTVIFGDDRMRRLEIQWESTVDFPRDRVVRASGRAWRVYPGIGFGTTLRELERLNGAPFELTGFGGHASGTVTSFRSGRLAPFDARADRWYSHPLVTVALSPYPPCPHGVNIEGYESEKVYLSSDPGMRQVNPCVVSIVVRPR